MYQRTSKALATVHSPDGIPIHVPNNGTIEGEGITRTGRTSSQLPSNITYTKESTYINGLKNQLINSNWT